jgi:aminoglycoside phosphotransferase
MSAVRPLANKSDMDLTIAARPAGPLARRCHNVDVLDSLRRRFRGRTWVPVTLGLSGAKVWRLDGNPVLYVKTTEHAQHHDGGTSLRAEADRLRWLAARGLRVPEVVDAGVDDQFSWLVTTALAGRTAADPWPEAQRSAVVDALADIASTLHAVPTDGCPFDRRLAVVVPLALEAADRDLVDLVDLDAERSGWTATQLAEALLATRPHDEDPVVCHGDFCLPNVLLDPSTLEVVGLVDVGRTGVADRHADIALITRSLGHDMNSQFGPDYAHRFIDRYVALSGASITDAKLDFFRLLDEFF